MLSPHTPAGVKVVCINAADCEGYLYEGQVYTVRAILPPVRDYWGVVLEEVLGSKHPTGAFKACRFRRAELPSCLTELLNTETV